MQSIVAVMGLGIATGYLVSKNRVIKHQIDNAVAGYEGSAEPATDGVTSAEIRSTRKLTNHVKFGDFKERSRGLRTATRASLGVLRGGRRSALCMGCSGWGTRRRGIRAG